jgi:hypothetical protein
MPEPVIYVLCEGPTDKRVLDGLLADKLGLFVNVRALGGDDSPTLSGVRAYLERETEGKPVVVSIRDRNFRPIEQVDEAWRDQACKTLWWRRHEIENYLLDPNVVHELLRAFCAEIEPPFREEPLTDLLIEALIESYEPRKTFAAGDDFADLADRLQRLRDVPAA